MELPTNPSSTRVAVWRELRRMGALSLQQACVALPDVASIRDKLEGIKTRIRQNEGEDYHFVLQDLEDATESRLRDDWNALRSQEYAEIVEECETKFLKEVEFEIFRDNLTAAEAEELEVDLEKTRNWLETIKNRDHFGAAGRSDAEEAALSCERALEDFVERVFVREGEEGASTVPPQEMPWGTTEVIHKSDDDTQATQPGSNSE